MNKIGFAVALAPLLFTGCAPTRPVHYYTLAPTSALPSDAKSGGPTIVVGAMVTPEVLQDGRIRYRSAGHESGSYEYHRWEERPGTMVRDSLVRALRASGKYQRVLESSSSAVGDYLLHGKLTEFAEVDSPAVQTKISLHLELVETKTNRNVWDHHFDRDEPASGKNIKDVVDSMDRNLQQVVAGAAAELDRYLSGAH